MYLRCCPVDERRRLDVGWAHGSLGRGQHQVVGVLVGILLWIHHLHQSLQPLPGQDVHSHHWLPGEREDMGTPRPWGQVFQNSDLRFCWDTIIYHPGLYVAGESTIDRWMWVKTLYPQWTSRLMVIPYTTWLVGFDPYPDDLPIEALIFRGFPRRGPQVEDLQGREGHLPHAVRREVPGEEGVFFQRDPEITIPGPLLIDDFIWFYQGGKGKIMEHLP